MIFHTIESEHPAVYCVRLCSDACRNPRVSTPREYWYCLVKYVTVRRLRPDACCNPRVSTPREYSYCLVKFVTVRRLRPDACRNPRVCTIREYWYCLVKYVVRRLRPDACRNPRVSTPREYWYCLVNPIVVKRLKIQQYGGSKKFRCRLVFAWKLEKIWNIVLLSTEVRNKLDQLNDLSF